MAHKQPKESDYHPLAKVATGSYFYAMRAVGIKSLKNKLSEYVRLAAAGETVLVTDRDRIVAELRPPSPERSASLHDALLADAVRKGWIAPATERSDQAPTRAPVASLAEVLDGLSNDRGGR